MWRGARWLIILGIWAGLAGLVALVWLSRDLPRPDTALDAGRRPGLTLLDRNGGAFATFGDVVGDPLRLAQMPRCLPRAAVAIEDRRFWTHPGIDPLGILRAAWVNLTSGRVVQGGSTITQQVAKTLFLSNARTFRRKVQELMLTFWLEQSFTKSEILEIWLNRVYLGSGAWGVDAAARLYFGVSARSLNLWQCAVLAGLPRAPSRINPRADPEAAAQRGREVLAAMAETGAISHAEAEEAGRRIAFAPRPAAAGWFAAWVAEAAETLLPPAADATLRTTLDPRLQGVVESRLAALLDGPGAGAQIGQGAVVVMDAATGAVRAMVGGRDFQKSPFNRAVAARRQPGSVFKPFVWIAALEAGMQPDDPVLDAPIRLGGWSPQNFEGTYRGEITLEEALAHSVNTVAVRLAQQVGGPRVVARVARRLGVEGALPDDLTIALGTGQMSVMEAAAAYAAIFNGGTLMSPTGIESAEVAHRPLPLPREAGSRVLSPEVAARMVRMLAAVVRLGSGRAAAVPGLFVAGKTGTTQDSRDAWFVGEAGGSIIAIWLGNDDNRPMKGVIGGGAPARLFHEIAASLR